MSEEETKKESIVEEEMTDIKSIKTDDKLMWVEKYRPASLKDLISHEEIISTISNLVKANKLPHLLFHGPPGTGKTSTIIAIAKDLYGKNYQNFVLELNASDERGIDVVRNQIKEFASTRKIFSTGFKLIILDEADHMTKDAQNALRRVIEKHTSNTRFCLICNYVNKIIPALQSRCTKFRFQPLTKSQVVKRLSSIADEEKIKYNTDGLSAIYRLSKGDMRKCVMILQSTNMSFNEINEKNVYLCTGYPLRQDIHSIVTWCLNEKFDVAFDRVYKLKEENGYAIVDIIKDAHLMVLRLKVSDNVKMFLTKQLADIEYRVSFGTDEKIQLAAMISSFQIARESVTSKYSVEQIGKKGSIE
eukprot:gene10913-3618_t